MDVQEFNKIFKEIQVLQKSMKNMMEIVFASSPLLALSTHGWASRSYHSMYLLRVSDGLVGFFSGAH
jgi:hypothetical protein